MADQVEKNNSEPENVTEKTETTEPSALESKIIRQIEYYFGDANLARDKFLLEAVKKNDGWVELTVLLTFNRLKALSEDKDVIVGALKKSSNGLVEVNEGSTAIRRLPSRALPSSTESEEQKLEMQKRLLYVKGFPTDSSLDDLIEFFDQYGVESVQQRKDLQKNFKGSVFVQFSSAEKAKEFLDADEIKYKDTPLIQRLYKGDYFQKKSEERYSHKQDEVKRKEEAKQKREQEEKEQLLARITRGSVLKVTGIKAGTAMDAIKGFFGKFGKVAWVDFDKGDDHAMVRFASENEAKEAWSKAVEAGDNDVVKLEESELSAAVLEGDEEEEHWKKMFESINSRFGNKKHKSFRGGKHGFNKRRGEQGGGPDTKKTKTADV